jgi:hypothetical protein
MAHTVLEELYVAAVVSASMVWVLPKAINAGQHGSVTCCF